jgi:hypothetical protein
LIAAGIPEKRGTLELSGDGDVRGTRPEDLAMLNENPSWRLQDTLWMARMTVAWSAWILLIGGVLAVAALWREQAIRDSDFAAASHGVWLLTFLLIGFNPMVRLAANRLLRRSRLRHGSIRPDLPEALVSRSSAEPQSLEGASQHASIAPCVSIAERQVAHARRLPDG